jgi:UDP:flavonoid glycosyltransferase YjiC (YdhE family)
MRILFTSWPALGHLYPMFPLARAAARAGHAVVFASGGDVVDGLHVAGFEARAVGPTKVEARAARPAPPADAADRSPQQSIMADLQEMFAPGGVRRAEALLPVARQWRPDLIVHEPGDLSGAAVAALLGVPSVMHGVSVVPPGFAAYLEVLASATEKPLAITGLADRVLNGVVLDLTPPVLAL